ncbi:MAG: triosephosphate isomerase [Phenylobacterium sp.]|jgi:triosephosphate isomerase
MSIRAQLAVANWKLNGDLTLVEQMSTALNQLPESATEAVICPAYPFLSAVSLSKKNFSLGCQNMSQHSDGAFTGEVSASMLKACDVKYVIVGHSERRAIYKESDLEVAEKFQQAISQGLIPILCVGETERQRMDEQTEEVIATQINAVIEQVGIAAFEQAVIAYEPVWAIGTGKTATVEVAQAVHQFIRGMIATHSKDISANLPILYGGSVNSGNSEALFAQADIDGGLVGGASLKVDEFMAICQAF